MAAWIPLIVELEPDAQVLVENLVRWLHSKGHVDPNSVQQPPALIPVPEPSPASSDPGPEHPI